MPSPTTARRSALIPRCMLLCIVMLVAQTTRAESETAMAPPGYRLGIFPYLAPRNAIDLYGPVSHSMAHALGVPVKLESSPSFSGFLDGIAAQVYDIALIQPFDYFEVVEKQGYVPLARLSAPLVTQFFVRDDSAYQTLQDLRGTRVAMPPALSANARMALRALHDSHLIPGRDVDVRYFNSHDSCLQQVWIGNASACGTAQPPVTIFEQHMKAKLRPIHATPAIPHILFVAHPRVPPAQRAALQKLIIGWRDTEDGRSLLSGLSFPGFVPVRAGEYAVMRDYDVSAPAAQATPPPAADLVLGVFPYLPARQLAEQLAPLNAALGAAIGKNVQLRTAGSFGNFIDSVTGGSYDVILVQPFDYRLATKQGYLPLVRMAGDIDAHVFVRIDSPYQRIEDLRGRNVAMPPFESAMSRLGRFGLREAGLIPGRDLAVDYRRDHESCLAQIQLEQSAACITSSLALKMVSPESSARLRSIADIGTAPGIVFLAHPRVPEPLRARMRNELLSWGDSDAGRARIEATRLGPFIPVDAAAYQALPQLEDEK